MCLLMQLKAYFWSNNKPICNILWSDYWQEDDKVDISVIPKLAAL
jgi:hypothetical protein